MRLSMLFQNYLDMKINNVQISSHEDKWRPPDPACLTEVFRRAVDRADARLLLSVGKRLHPPESRGNLAFAAGADRAARIDGRRTDRSLHGGNRTSGPAARPRDP